jgi:LmbE family N-acetylglucosaminyl deacetylase
MSQAVFLVPHQDDEILTMGAYIRQHVEAGREVVVVMVTDGSASGARAKLKAEKGYDLSESAFSKARDREFIDCMQRLGVPSHNLYFENLQDGTLTLAKAKSVWRKYIANFPAASYKTMSWIDEHKDHYLLGRALDELNNNSEVPNGDARFCRSFLYSTAPTPGGSNQTADANAIRLAADAYGVWSPNSLSHAGYPGSGPRYGIGHLSVPSMFTTLDNNPVTFVHQGSWYYSASKLAEANDWLTSRGLNGYL